MEVSTDWPRVRVFGDWNTHPNLNDVQIVILSLETQADVISAVEVAGVGGTFQGT